MFCSIFILVERYRHVSDEGLSGTISHHPASMNICIAAIYFDFAFCLKRLDMDCDSSKNERPRRENVGRYFDDDIPGTYLPIAENCSNSTTSHNYTWWLSMIDLWPITLHYDHNIYMKHYLLSFIIHNNYFPKREYNLLNPAAQVWAGLDKWTRHWL